MKTKALIVGSVMFILLVVGLAGQQRSLRPEPADSNGADPAIIAKLKEIVAIRERAAENFEMLRQVGRAPSDGQADIELAEARIELAREQGPKDAVVAELKSLVSVHERRLAGFQTLAKDRLPLGSVDRARAALLEAEVRLLRAQK